MKKIIGWRINKLIELSKSSSKNQQEKADEERVKSKKVFKEIINGQKDNNDEYFDLISSYFLWSQRAYASNNIAELLKEKYQTEEFKPDELYDEEPAKKALRLLIERSFTAQRQKELSNELLREYIEIQNIEDNPQGFADQLISRTVEKATEEVNIELFNYSKEILELQDNILINKKV